MSNQHNLSGVDSITGAIYSTGERAVLIARADANSGFLTVRRRSHGTYFERSMHVTEIIDLLDPDGTTVKRVS